MCRCGPSHSLGIIWCHPLKLGAGDGLRVPFELHRRWIPTHGCIATAAVGVRCRSSTPTAAAVAADSSSSTPTAAAVAADSSSTPLPTSSSGKRTVTECFRKRKVVPSLHMACVRACAWCQLVARKVLGATQHNYCRSYGRHQRFRKVVLRPLVRTCLLLLCSSHCHPLPLM